MRDEKNKNKNKNGANNILPAKQKRDTSMPHRSSIGNEKKLITI